MRMLQRSLSCLGLCVALAAQGLPDGASGQGQGAAWLAFQQEVGGQWMARWHPATGTPEAIYGEGLPLDDWRSNDLGEARRHAGAALHRFATLLGLGTSEFRESIGARMGRTWTFTYEQWFRGLPVIGGRADVRIHMKGRLTSLGSVAWPVPADFATTPTIDEANAARLAWRGAGVEPNAVPQPGKPRPVRLVIWGDAASERRAPIHLAWEVPISAVDRDGNGPIGRAYVDARNGEFLRLESDRHECGFAGCRSSRPDDGRHGPAAEGGPLPPATYTVMGYAHTAFSPVSTPTNAPLAGIEINVPGLGTVVTDANGQFIADLNSPTNITVRLDGIRTQLIAGSNAVTQGAVLQPGQNATIQLLSPTATEQQLAHTTCYYWTHQVNEFARGILGNTPQLATRDNVLPTVNISSTCNAYYANNTINFYASGGGCNNTASASVVAHEWGHGLDDAYGGISQTNGLSEGWADICSIYLLDDPTIAHDFYTNGATLRTGTNTRQYPTGSGPHDQGESWMGFAWKARENLRQALGSQTAIAISNDIVLGTIAANATNQQNAVLQVFLADDDDGNLNNGTPHHQYLAAACTAHNLPFPPILAGTLQHTQLTATGAQLTPRVATVAAIPTFGAFTQVRLHWNDGQNRQRVMIPTGATNEWQAMLPGVLAPTTVTYHFEAAHDSNAVLRLPVSGEFQYLVQAERRIFFDDFENGGIGWTHGAITGVDDWQIGVPAGLSGSGWSDPSAAASGNQCAGTDLGIPGDGAYSPNSESWLRSPPINCTGITGIRLRFKRWMTIDAYVRDRAEMRVGTSLFWINPTLQPQIDTGWVVYEQALSFANNNPSVVLEFRIRTDATIAFGGWNIDDVELYTTASSVPLPAELRLLPEQSPRGGPMTLSVNTAGAQPFALLLGDQPGPSSFPGLPPLQVGNYAVLPGYTNSSGLFQLNFTAPSAIGPTGAMWYSQVITLDASNAIVLSNQFVNLFTP